MLGRTWEEPGKKTPTIFCSYQKVAKGVWSCQLRTRSEAGFWYRADLRSPNLLDELLPGNVTKTALEQRGPNS